MGWTAPETDEEVKTQWTAPASDTQDSPTGLDSFGRGSVQGASLGFADEFTGGGRALEQKVIDYVMGNKNGDSLGENYRTYRDEMRDKDEAAAKANPKTYLGGQFVGGAATAPLVGEANVAKMAALAGLQGFGSSRTDLTRRNAGQELRAAKDTAIGAGIGAGTGALLKGAGALVDPENWNATAKAAALRALGYTKRFLNSPGKRAAADRAAQTMLDKGVITPFASADEMAGRVTDLIDSSGKSIDRYLTTRGSGYDTSSMVNAIEALRPQDSTGRMLTGGHYDDVNAVVDKAISTVKAHGDVISFKDANDLKGTLQDIAKFGSSTGERGMERRIAGAARESIDTSLENLSNKAVPDNPDAGTGMSGADLLEAAKAAFPVLDRASEDIPEAKAAVDALEHAISLAGATDPEIETTAAAVSMAAPELLKAIKIAFPVIDRNSTELFMATDEAGSVQDLLAQLRIAIGSAEKQPISGKAIIKTPEQNNQEFQDFIENKKTFKAGLETEDALANRLSSEGGNKNVSLTDTILGGTLAGGEIAAGHLPVGAAAAMGVKKLVEKYGGTGTAWGANKIANTLNSTADVVSRMLKTSPEQLGRYAGMLTKAAAEGGQSLAVRHFVLSNTDPDYRVMIRNIGDKQ